MKIKGILRPLRDRVIVSDMQFGMEKTAGGIVLLSDDGKTQGIKPRWGKVFAIGPDQKDVKIGEWVLVEHGRWSRGTIYENDKGDEIEIRLVDNNAILLSSAEQPNDAMRNYS